MSKLKNSRRKFLSLNLSGGASSTNTKSSSDKPEKVKMLTPDGQLVEIDMELLDQVSNRKQANNKDILNWTKSVKDK